MQKPRPHLLFADKTGTVFDHPHLLMLCRKGDEMALPRPDELSPLPPGSDIFLLPGRQAIGLDPENGQAEMLEENAVAAFVCPGYTITGISAYKGSADAPALPLMAYGAVGYANGRFWVCAKKTDQDTRQVFTNISQDRIAQGARKLLQTLPKNRLIAHLAHCALTWCCPAAKNLALGRYEAPLPTARACNARCIGCISLQDELSQFTAPQDRIDFCPTPKEIAEVMTIHSKREKKSPIYSFGQGCEGEPLTEATTIAAAVTHFRTAGGKGTVNINTNASLPETITPLAKAGVNSIRVSLNSADSDLYSAYYRPKNYSGLDAVKESLVRAKENALFVSLNLLFFPGVTDTEAEWEKLCQLVNQHKIDYIQLRNLNLDPNHYLELAMPHISTPGMGFTHFKKRLKKENPWLNFGYFNPYLG